MSTATYTVKGMTCGHCVSSVKEEVGEVAGVTSVDVDLKSGRLTVVSDGPVNETEISGAVKEAGYELVGVS
ncbi:heavy-metal-associated domain-containing protein [Nonomuraea ferruginea]|uniref:Heavy-metal-associated domain-containing protein n=1 Tax=Nonomuraea ferruginea TaxID=46174 RepID=A0ABT4TCI7_9ACTN|nr:heavy-metal-associated domain-containing protein [Nonomuraea ferruginea]MDA0646954.1 heavy-metal-associated domain-containing protein [Nonomuraea ferruginea]